MMLFSMLLGHADNMVDGTMNLPVYEPVRMYRAERGTRYAVNNLQDRGTEGLESSNEDGLRRHRVR
jgi:hypothetical protein